MGDCNGETLADMLKLAFIWSGVLEDIMSRPLFYEFFLEWKAELEIGGKTEGVATIGLVRSMYE